MHNTGATSSNRRLTNTCTPTTERCQTQRAGHKHVLAAYGMNIKLSSVSSTSDFPSSRPKAHDAYALQMRRQVVLFWPHALKMRIFYVAYKVAEVRKFTPHLTVTCLLRKGIIPSVMFTLTYTMFLKKSSFSKMEHILSEMEEFPCVNNMLVAHAPLTTIIILISTVVTMHFWKHPL